MRFSSLSTADKMKAGGLAGLIVVVLFFVVHTTLGAISPPTTSSDTPSAQAVSEQTAEPQPVGDVPAAPTNPGAPQPGVTPPAVASGAKQVTGLGIAGLDMHDPFVPIRDTDKPFSAPAPPSRRADMAPSISVQSSLPAPGEMSPGFPSVAPASPGPPPPAPEPVIHLVGFIHGDTAVATMQVDGRGMLCRPGDLVAAKYRLVGVSPEAVHLRHGHTLLTLRTGETINEPTRAGLSAPAHP